MSASRLADWEAYDNLEPIGEWRADLRMAAMCSVITNLAKGIHGKKDGKLTTPEDFMFDWDGLIKESSKQKQSAEEMKENLLKMFKK